MSTALQFSAPLESDFCKQLRLIRLLQLTSPALPVGGFAYSQGMESAVENQLITNQSQTYEWVSGLLGSSLQRLDLPALHHQTGHITAAGFDQVAYTNERLIAFRETAELRKQSLQMGRALIKLLVALPIAAECTLPIAQLHTCLQQDTDWITAFAYAAALNAIPSEEALLGFAWSWCENQIAAAIKLVPLGQTQGQICLHKLGLLIPEVCDKAGQIPLESIGALAPHLAILSSQHETQYSRLFRS